MESVRPSGEASSSLRRRMAWPGSGCGRTVARTAIAGSRRHGAQDGAQLLVLLGGDLAAALVADIVHGELQESAHPVLAVVGVDRRGILGQHRHAVGYP